MGRDGIEMLSQGVVRRRTKRVMGVFVDATGLDRATRRIGKRIDLGRLVTGLGQGLKLEVGKYYVLIPHEDDARQLAYLDAVERAGLEVITKRLPPKGVNRHVSMDVHMAVDMINFCHGAQAIAGENLEIKSQANGPDIVTSEASQVSREVRRAITVVCPSRELSYALYTCNQLGADVTLADFGLFGSSDGWKGVDRWIDLSTSETIWR